MVWCLCCHIYIFLSISSCKDFLWLFVFYLAYLFCLSVIFFVGSFWVRARPFRHALRVVCKGSLRGPIPEAFSIVTFGTSSSRNHPPFCHVPPSLAFVHPTEVRSWSAEAVASQVGFYCRPCVQRRPFLLRSAGWPLGRLCFEVLCENWSSQAVHLLKTKSWLAKFTKISADSLLKYCWGHVQPTPSGQSFGRYLPESANVQKTSWQTWNITFTAININPRSPTNADSGQKPAVLNLRISSLSEAVQRTFKYRDASSGGRGTPRSLEW